MKIKLLGSSGLRVSELCLGAMTFGEDWGWGASKETSRQIFDRYIDRGGNFIDTANRYTNGVSEKYTGEFISDEREKIVLATKYTLSTRAGDPNGSGNHRKNMMQSLDASLKNIGTDYIDLYWVHAWDSLTPEEEIMRALDDMVSAGKIFYIGISDTPAWVVSRSNTIADLRGWTSFVALQIRYSLIDRTAERELLPMAKAMDLAVTPWSVLGGGVLSGKFNKSDGDIDTKRHIDKTKGEGPLADRNMAIAATTIKVAEEIGCTPSQVALAWVMQQSENIIPILGARTLAQIEDNLGCTEVKLTADQLSMLNKMTAIEPGFPHEFLQADYVKEMLYSGTLDRIVNHRR